MKKAMTKIAQGTKKTEGNVWYAELSDKSKLTIVIIVVMFSKTRVERILP